MEIKEIKINSIDNKRAVVIKLSSILALYSNMNDNTFIILTSTINTKNIYFNHTFKYNPKVFFNILNIINQYKSTKVDDYIIIFNDDSEVCLLSTVKFV